MGSSKATASSKKGVYREERDDASSSTAVLLDDVDAYPDDEPPAYSDIPAVTGSAPGHHEEYRNLVPPLPVFASPDTFHNTIWTRFPNYSTDAIALEKMIREQAMYPPVYRVRIHGTHTENASRKGEGGKNTVEDFDINVNMTHLLSATPGQPVEDHVELLEDSRRGFRGGVWPSTSPTLFDIEEGGELRAWCQHYVDNPSGWKSFTMKREVRNHDTAKLEQMIRSMVASTNYRGHLNVNFSTQYGEVVVLSPGKINDLRTIRWLRWFFYLTFLWIFAWPVLFFLTRRYDVVKAVFNYSSDSSGSGQWKPTVMSETMFFQRWEKALRRGVMGRFRGTMEDEYRIATLAQEDGARVAARNFQQARTGNAFADGALSLLGSGLQLANDYHEVRGWGADT